MIWYVLTHICVKVSTSLWSDGRQRSLAIHAEKLESLKPTLCGRMPEITDIVQKGKDSDYCSIVKIYFFYYLWTMFSHSWT